MPALFSVSSCRAVFALFWFSLLLASPLHLLLCCLRAAHALSAPCARCSVLCGTVPAAPRAAPPAAPPAAPRTDLTGTGHWALGPSQCPTLAVRTSATASHTIIIIYHNHNIPPRCPTPTHSPPSHASTYDPQKTRPEPPRTQQSNSLAATHTVIIM